MGRTPKNRRLPEDDAPSGLKRGPMAALAVSALLVLAVAIVFGQTIGYDYVNFDDDAYVYQNPQVVRGLTLDGVAAAFTRATVSNWHPVTSISHMLDCQLYGLPPGGHHLTNVLLHAAAAVLLFLVLLRMSGDFWPSAFAAAVFAIHPLRVESVAWISERKDVLSGVFFMLTLAAYVAYARRPFSIPRYLLVAVLFALGLMAKPMLVTLPFLLLLLDYWPLRRWDVAAAPPEQLRFSVTTRLVVEKLPLFAMSAASCVATVMAQHTALQAIANVPLGWRIANALVAYAAYLGQTVYPVGLAALYPHPGSSLPIWKAVAAAIVLAGFSAGAWACRKKYPYLFVGWFWYLGMLAPVIGIVQVGRQAMADRYTYLPQIGLCVALAWGIGQLIRSWPRRHWIGGAAALLVVAILMEGAWRQASYWSDSVTLWRQTLACTPGNYVATLNLANGLTSQGKVDEAIVLYQNALQASGNEEKIRQTLGKTLTELYNHLGVALANSGRGDEAILRYREALKIDSNDVPSYYNLGNALASCGKTKEAIAAYREALKIASDDAQVHSNLGLALLNSGQPDEAVVECRKAVDLQPDDAEIQNNLGMVLARTDKLDDAIVQYQRALKINPNYAEAANNLGNVFARCGRVEEALAQYRLALELAVQQKKQAMAEGLRARLGLAQPGSSSSEAAESAL